MITPGIPAPTQTLPGMFLTVQKLWETVIAQSAAGTVDLAPIEAEIAALQLEVAGLAPLASPAFTGNPQGVTESPGNNSISLATTAYADAIAALKANLASPAFTGTPSAPTLDITGAAPGTPVLGRGYASSFPKAWVVFTVSGGACTVVSNLNVSSVTYIAAGVYQINFATALNDAHYAVASTVGYEATQDISIGIRSSATKLVGSCQLVAQQGGAAIEAQEVNAIFFGN